MTKKRGFTLAELLIVMMIIAILAVVASVSYNSARIKARDSKRISDSQTIGAAVEQYYEVNGEYPNSKNCGTGATTKIPTTDWCNSKLTGTGGQWIKDLNTTTLTDFLSVVPVDPINDAPTSATSIDSNAYFYYAYSATDTTKLQTYYLVMTLEDSNNTFFVQNMQGIAGDSDPSGNIDGSVCYNGSQYFIFNATGSNVAIVTLGRNRSDTRVPCI